MSGYQSPALLNESIELRTLLVRQRCDIRQNQRPESLDAARIEFAIVHYFEGNSRLNQRDRKSVV